MAVTTYFQVIRTKRIEVEHNNSHDTKQPHDLRNVVRDRYDVLGDYEFEAKPIMSI